MRAVNLSYGILNSFLWLQEKNETSAQSLAAVLPCDFNGPQKGSSAVGLDYLPA